MPRENRGAFLRGLGRIFNDGSASTDETTDGVFRAMSLANLSPTALLAAAVAVMLAVTMAVGTMLTMDLTRSTARGFEGAIIAEPAGAVVTGRVLDGDGGPIVGARVARGSDRAKAPFVETTTDAEGRFTFEDVPAGELILTARARGRAPDLRELTIGRGRQSVEFRLGPGASIRGRVVDVHDRPLAGALVAVDEWRGHRSLDWSMVTDVDGRFRWDEAPNNSVRIAVGKPGNHADRRYCLMIPHRAERTIVMCEPLHIRGSVIDAETGRTITSFTIVSGHSWGDGEPVTWEYERPQEVTGASYDITLSTIYPRHFLYVRADGHEDGVSRAFHAGENRVDFDFRLRRGNWTEGVVRLPDRSPLAGAVVHLVSPSNPLSINDHSVPGGLHGEIPFKTGAAGRFRFERQEPPYTILVIHDRGCAEQTVKVHPPGVFDLTIQPWGRIEGTLRIGKRPGARERIWVYHDHHDDPPDAVLSWIREETTDDSGRFVFDRIRPGMARVMQVVRVENPPDTWTTSPTLSEEIDVAPNATARVDLGGTGRPVVGKLTAPAELAGRVNWLDTDNTLTAKPTPADRLSTAIKDPSRAIDGRSAQLPRSVIADKAGSFRIEDVPAGTYDLNFEIRKPALNLDDWPTKAMATARREVTVPEMPGGRSDEPLDLGTIPLVPVKNP
jgi:protocatechuate 3,4-dioxygenase beta subunit